MAGEADSGDSELVVGLAVARDCSLALSDFTGGEGAALPWGDAAPWGYVDGAQAWPNAAHINAMLRRGSLTPKNTGKGGIFSLW